MSTAKVRLAPLTPADSGKMFQWINAREQVIFGAPYKPVHQASHEAWFDSVQKRSDGVIFAIRAASDDQLIGSCQLLNINHVHGAAELQIRIGDIASRGRGYGSDAVRLLLRFAFRDLNLHRIYLHVFATNTVAERVYARLAFRREGVLREAAHIDGRYLDIIVMGVLKSEFDALDVDDA